MTMSSTISAIGAMGIVSTTVAIGGSALHVSSVSQSMMFQTPTMRMEMIWLKYKKGSTTTARRINELAITPRDDAERMIGRNLRGNDYDTLLSERNIYMLQIGADELQVSACRTFMRSFFCGAQRWIALSAASTEPAPEAFIAVTVPGGVDPIEFLEDYAELPFVTYTLTEKNART